MSHGSVSAATGGRSSNGRTPDSGSGYPGSNPGLPAKSFQQLSLTFFPHGNICGNNLGAAVGGSFRKERRPPDRLGLSGAVFQTRTDGSSGTKGRMSRTSGDWRRTQSPGNWVERRVSQSSFTMLFNTNSVGADLSDRFMRLFFVTDIADFNCKFR